MKNSLAHVDIMPAIYRYQGLRPIGQKTDYKKEVFTAKAFLEEIKIRKDLRDSYKASEYTGSDEELEKAIEVIRRQD